LIIYFIFVAIDDSAKNLHKEKRSPYGMTSLSSSVLVPGCKRKRITKAVVPQDSNLADQVMPTPPSDTTIQILGLQNQLASLSDKTDSDSELRKQVFRKAIHEML
jgi:hypothetical protein